MNVHTHAIVEKVVVVDGSIILKWTKTTGCEGAPWISVGTSGGFLWMWYCGVRKGRGKISFILAAVSF